MNAWLALPIELRMLLLLLTGAFAGGQINRAIYRLRSTAASIDPWTPKLDQAPARSWFDRIPIFGWLSLSREVPLHGGYYWIRPLLIELFFALFTPYYYWIVVSGDLVPEIIMTPAANMQGALHATFVSHLTLVCFMAVATFIDFDERLIPDEITIPGFLLGLVFAAALPMSLLTVPDPPVTYVPVTFDGTVEATFLRLTTGAEDWPAYLNGPTGLAIALALYLGWWFAICPKIIWRRKGWKRACDFLVGSMRRYALTPFNLGLLAVGLIGITAVWWIAAGSDSWQGMLSALVGMAFAGALVWLVRIFAGAALGREAMGFGDVTLMFMIGAYAGWQPAIAIFFLAPMIACLFAVIRWLTTGDVALAFGPYLCFGTLFLFLYWPSFWQQYSPMLVLGWILPAIFLALPVAVGMILWPWQIFKERVLFRDS
ncbi:prepilin peptidase [Blastopirellula marina]|uniref:Probable type 4 prepilin-like proteins leader peptide processing enzyme n=1 Tax=Blastopirellula marina DSM 3645 TaxID=314230 RepID=A4A189_9BACT|nr:A24 family peptidase [Blastopirellula marina]EAQ77441.1 probable type 4 prepilin-like proteins leader peptide processing enzyme [Blastopirellula marina DSM 3645]